MSRDRRKESPDLAALRARLAGMSGQQYWRSLEELGNTAEFQDLLRHEFPRGADELKDPISRRTFLKLMGASLALAGLTGCGPRANEPLVPYVEQPEAIVPGRSLFYTTAMPLSGYAIGLLAESYMGRPVKIEGNPRHPASLGATDVFAQAALLTLYDPDRSQAVINIGRISTWDAFLGQLTSQLQAQGGSQGAGLRILTETVTSPTLAAQFQALLAKYPAARWHQYQPIGGDNSFEGARLAFGQPVNTIYRFDKATRILSLDADFLLRSPGRLSYARAFIDGRRVRAGQAQMNRLYVVESTPTITGAMADHRLPLRAAEVEGFARVVAQRLGVAGASGTAPAAAAGWLDALVRDLQQSRGASIVVAGEDQPPIVHALAHAMNDALGNVGATVIHTPPVEANPVNSGESLRTLVADMNAGQVSMLVILGGNPAFDAPADLRFADALAKVGFRVHLGLYADETAELCHWHLPEAHFLESWGDARAFDGTASIIQPLIAPLYGGRSAYELLGVLLGQSSPSGYEIVRGYWQSQRPGGNFDQFWRQSLNAGVIDGSVLAPLQVTLNTGFAAQPAAPAGQGLEVVFRPDPTIWDGRFANNGWLQELPKQMTMLTWDNAALIAPATAVRLGLASQDLVELRYRGRSVRAPVWVTPGQPVDSIMLTLGYGRTRTGRVGTGTGFNAYALRASDALWFGDGLEIVKTGERYPLATTQDHFSMEGRDLVKLGTLAEFQQNPNFIQVTEQQVPGEGTLSLYPEDKYDGYKWGMAIDTNACIGCNACTIACQAENNIPVVGKDQVLVSREMHWLKVDRYYTGTMDNPDMVAFQPRPCMQCEKAPCELVCPVAATVHSAEGLNDMVYNRCVGTRYCSNNCPYKVRRFNFFQYSHKDIPVIKLGWNPEVTVRDRGVMEKCTYCVQRINNGRIESEKAGRQIADGDVKTACQEVCPTQAIIFGNLNDPNSQVAKLKGQPLNYGLLAELGTQPRTSYLARLRNPNPEIKTE